MTPTQHDLNWVMMTRAGGGVKRCHTLAVIGEQTVAAHTFGVICLLMAFCKGNPPRELMIAALFHDLPEQETGDVPATAKWKHGDKHEELEADFRTRWNLHMPLSQYQELMLYCADKVELMLFSCEQLAQGNTTFQVVFDRLAERLGPMIKTMPEQVRTVYMELLEDQGWLEFHQEYAEKYCG